MKLWESVFSILLILPASKTKFTPKLLSEGSTSEQPAVQEDGWRMDVVFPFYQGLAVGLAIGTSVAMVLCVGFSVWLWKRGWNLTCSGGTSGDGRKTKRRDSGLHGDYLELMPRAPLPPEPSDNDPLGVRESALNEDYLEPGARARVPSESPDNKNVPDRFSLSSGAEYSEPNFPPDCLEPVSGPYESLRMAEVGVPSVYSQVRYHGNQTQRHT